MGIDRNSGSVISLQTARQYIAAFKAKCPTETKAYFVGIDKLNLILDQANCIGVRMYNGVDETGKSNLVLVGVDNNEKDMASGVILEKLVPCPSHCDSQSPLTNP